MLICTQSFDNNYYNFRTWPVHYDEEAVNIIRNWIVCNVTKLPESSLSDGFLGRSEICL